MLKLVSSENFMASLLQNVQVQNTCFEDFSVRVTATDLESFKNTYLYISNKIYQVNLG